MTVQIVELTRVERSPKEPLCYGKLACGHTQLVRADRKVGNTVKCGQCKREYRHMMRSVYPALFR